MAGEPNAGARAGIGRWGLWRAAEGGAVAAAAGFGDVPAEATPYYPPPPPNIKAPPRGVLVWRPNVKLGGFIFGGVPPKH